MTGICRKKGRPTLRSMAGLGCGTPVPFVAKLVAKAYGGELPRRLHLDGMKLAETLEQTFRFEA